tara:strand:+ start:8527 stop:9381 length:855 start_codon:yes stop_codon:yes gene_type:complete
MHLAGIVPVAGQPLDFGMPWHDCLIPIAQNYLAVERCVVECAAAGCDSIWVVCNDDMQPLIKHRLGEYVQDPVWVLRKFEYDQSGYQKPIPIYYVPIHPRDRNKRDCLSWSVLYGAWTAKRITGGLSTYLAANKYYVSFPYGVYDPNLVRAYRKEISSAESFFLSFNNKTIIDGEYLGFAFDNEIYDKLSAEVREKSTGLFRNEERKEKLSLDERFSYRFFSIQDVFESLTLEGAKLHEVSNYYNIDNWQEYCRYIGNVGFSVERPKESLLNYKEWNGIGIDKT